MRLQSVCQLYLKILIPSVYFSTLQARCSSLSVPGIAPDSGWETWTCKRQIGPGPSPVGTRVNQETRMGQATQGRVGARSARAPWRVGNGVRSPGTGMSPWQAAAVSWRGERVRGGTVGGGGVPDSGARAALRQHLEPKCDLATTRPSSITTLPSLHPNKGVFQKWNMGTQNASGGNWESWACVKFHSFPTALKSCSSGRLAWVRTGRSQPTVLWAHLLDPSGHLQAAAPYLGAPDPFCLSRG